MGWFTQKLAPGRKVYLLSSNDSRAGAVIDDNLFNKVVSTCHVSGVRIYNNGQNTRAVIYRTVSKSIRGMSSGPLLCQVRGRYLVVGFQSEEYRIGTDVAFKCAKLLPVELINEFRILDSIPTSWIPPEPPSDEDDETLVSRMSSATDQDKVGMSVRALFGA
jgi:hypothetical protein